MYGFTVLVSNDVNDIRVAVIGLIDPAYKEEIKAKIEAEYPKRHPKYKDAYEVNFCKTADGAALVKDLALRGAN